MNVTAILMGDPPPGRRLMLEQHKPQITLARNVGGGRPRLTPENVRTIKASTETKKVLARRYGVSPSAIKDIRMGRTWKHVT
jgi:hypothetical protein